MLAHTSQKSDNPPIPAKRGEFFGRKLETQLISLKKRARIAAIIGASLMVGYVAAEKVLSIRGDCICDSMKSRFYKLSFNGLEIYCQSPADTPYARTLGNEMERWSRHVKKPGSMFFFSSSQETPRFNLFEDKEGYFYSPGNGRIVAYREQDTLRMRMSAVHEMCHHYYLNKMSAENIELVKKAYAAVIFAIGDRPIGDALLKKSRWHRDILSIRQASYLQSHSLITAIRESSYVGDKRHGHPWDGPGEFFASVDHKLRNKEITQEQADVLLWAVRNVALAYGNDAPFDSKTLRLLNVPAQYKNKN